jgi:hypothetical protein
MPSGCESTDWRWRSRLAVCRYGISDLCAVCGKSLLGTSYDYRGICWKIIHNLSPMAWSSFIPDWLQLPHKPCACHICDVDVISSGRAIGIIVEDSWHMNSYDQVSSV